MVIEGFPVASLVAQILRQITKPASEAIVKQATKRPFLRKHVLIHLGRFYYWCEGTIRQENNSTVTRRKPTVDDARSIELGASLLLETLIFGLLWIAVVYETRRTAESSRAVEQLRVQEFDKLTAEKDGLMSRVRDQVILIERLEDVVKNYSKQVEYTLPSAPGRTRGEQEH